MATWRQEKILFKCADIILGLIIDEQIKASTKAIDIAKALQIELYKEFGKPFDETTK